MTRTVALQPVWDGYCADPFVLRTAEGYVMYGSAPALLPDGRAFQTLFSADLETWTDAGGALEPAAGAPAGTEYWAPEVVAANGLYWMYYSSGVSDVGHQLRVAKATDPLGPFWDVGVILTPDLPFAIDPSPFRDADGSWWLFFATDFLDSARPGTVLAVSAMNDMTSLGETQIVLTAFADWQRYEACRQIYRQVRDWHTLEGPTVVRRGDRYWMTYSGGNWHNAGYGVGLATAERLGGPWTPYGEGAAFLNSADSGLTGPGHNSLFSADGGNFAVFHAWDPSGTRRRPYIERVTWGVTGPALHS